MGRKGFGLCWNGFNGGRYDYGADLMHDYIGFALFQAGSLLARGEEAKLTQAVAELLKPLRPVDSTPMSRRS